MSKEILLRTPSLTDGMAVYRLVKQCPPLDENSSYCNILQCGHFAQTSVAAEVEGEIIGFISGYLKPDQPNTLFIWQVAVHEKARGLGLASKMLMHILNRQNCEQVRFLETTITEDNAGSWALFKRLSSTLSADLESSVWLEKKAHFDGEHESESLVRIGPFNLKQPKGKS